tara:strand:- start:51 stop:1127 length:1077 start_codon:yes stop_codon:yes gene_type:complete
MTFTTASNNDVVTVTSDGDIVQYKSDDYVNKVFKYFVLELVKENDETNILSESDIFNLINNKLEINQKNIDTQPKYIKNLYEDVMKLKNNYLFAYYLSRLYENRLLDNQPNSAQKYYDFSEYIIGLDIDFEKLDWSSLQEIKENNEELYDIYGEKMHRITNEFLNNGYIKEITKIENIDDVLKLYFVNVQTKLYDIKLSKLIDLQNEFNNLDLLNVKNNDENEIVHYDEYDEINEWYYGNDKNKKRKLEELVLNIIEKYEKNKRIKLINEEIEKINKKETYNTNIILKVLNLTIIYCFVSYMFMFYNNIINTNNDTKIFTENLTKNLTNNLTNNDNQCTNTYELINSFYNIHPFEFKF